MSLLTSLESYWKLNEASGNALDAHGSNTLTETSGTIGAATGKINGARDFEAADTEYFERTDNASLSVGDIDFTFSMWLQLESKSANMFALAKALDDLTGYEYSVVYNTSLDRMRFVVQDASNNFGIVTASAFGSVPTGTWIFVVVWHDATSNTLNIQINNGTVNSLSWTTGVKDSTRPFRLGAEQGGNYWDGLIDEVGFWKRVLTSFERTQLYNSGNGLPYENFATNRRRRVLIATA